MDQRAGTGRGARDAQSCLESWVRSPSHIPGEGQGRQSLCVTSALTKTLSWSENPFRKTSFIPMAMGDQGSRGAGMLLLCSSSCKLSPWLTFSAPFSPKTGGGGRGSKPADSGKQKTEKNKSRSAEQQRAVRAVGLTCGGSHSSLCKGPCRAGQKYHQNNSLLLRELNINSEGEEEGIFHRAAPLCLPACPVMEPVAAPPREAPVLIPSMSWGECHHFLQG